MRKWLLCNGLSRWLFCHPVELAYYVFTGGDPLYPNWLERYVGNFYEEPMVF